jgi:hypothetical protein
VTVTSPRLDPRLREAVPRLDDTTDPMAETWRKVGALADDLGCPRPGYDTIRLIVRDHRRRHAEVHELLEPVVADLLQGRVGAWDVERMIDAARLLRADP